MSISSRKALDHIQPYTPGMSIWEVQRQYGLTSVLKLASNENPLGPSPKAIQAIQECLSELYRYPDANTTRIRKAIADRQSLSIEQLIMTNGGDELIKLISETYLESGDEVIIPVPSFSEYEFGAHLMSAKIVPVPLSNIYRFDVKAILSAISDRTKIVYICSPNNPTGTYMTRNEMEELLEGLPSGVVMVLDGAYSHFAEAADYTDGVEFVRLGYPVIVLQTFSKIFGLAGLRIGYGIARESIIQQIMKVKEPFNVNTLAQAAAIAALEDEEHYQASRTLVTQGRVQLYEAFREFGFSFTESMGNFLLVEMGPEAKNLYQVLLSKGIILRHGAIWGLPNHVRISVGTKEENTVLINTIRHLLRELK